MFFMMIFRRMNKAKINKRKEKNCHFVKNKCLNEGIESNGKQSFLLMMIQHLKYKGALQSYPYALGRATGFEKT